MWSGGLALPGAFFLSGDDGVRDKTSGRKEGVWQHKQGGVMTNMAEIFQQQQKFTFGLSEKWDWLGNQRDNGYDLCLTSFQRERGRLVLFPLWTGLVVPGDGLIKISLDSPLRMLEVLLSAPIAPLIGLSQHFSVPKPLLQHLNVLRQRQLPPKN